MNSIPGKYTKQIKLFPEHSLNNNGNNGYHLGADCYVSLVLYMFYLCIYYVPMYASLLSSFGYEIFQHFRSVDH